MNMNIYAAEKMMQHRQEAIQRLARTAWMYSSKSGKESLIPQLIASYTSKKEAVTNAVNDACCNCCTVNP